VHGSRDLINCEAINAERNNRTKNNILEYKKKSTKRVHEEDHEEVSTMQREIVELNRLKKNKNRKDSWQVTLYLTLPLKLNSYKHQH
jgi:hypothetical protein